MQVEWQVFDYENKGASAPKHDRLVWVSEENDGRIDIGYFDGFTFRMWWGTDDCHISHWAEIEYPDPDAGEAWLQAGNGQNPEGLGLESARTVSVDLSGLQGDASDPSAEERIAGLKDTSFEVSGTWDAGTEPITFYVCSKACTCEHCHPGLELQGK